jgi:hypothetical protein
VANRVTVRLRRSAEDQRRFLRVRLPDGPVGPDRQVQLDVLAGLRDPALNVRLQDSVRPPGHPSEGRIEAVGAQPVEQQR